MSGWVTVIGPPLADCASNALSTDPFEPSTLPNRTDTQSMPVLRAVSAVSRSVIRFVQPSTLVGSAALSVLTLTNRSTSWRSAASSRLSVPHTFVFHPSAGCISSSGRCLRAAAWNTTSGRCIGEDLVDPGGVADVGDDQVGVVEHRPALDRELGRVQAVLVAVEHHQRRRLEAHDLAAQLAADRPAGAGDQHPPTGDVPGDRDRIDLGRMATEQVGMR